MGDDLGNSRKRIYLAENSDIRFEEDPETGEAVMFICGKPYVRKKLPYFSESMIRKHFKQEIEENKDIVCPVDMYEDGS